MAESRAQAALSYKPIRAPRGPALSCKGWLQEASLRLLMNSLDPAIAEHPEELIISGGVGKAARDWRAFHTIVKSLQSLEDDETLVIRDGEPGPAVKTNLDAPRVRVVNSTPPAADWMFAGPSSALPEAYQALGAAARKHFGGSFAGRLVTASGMGGMGGALPLAATLLGAASLGIDADVGSIKRRVKAGYCEVMVNNLDEALRILKNAVRKRAPASVGLIGNAAEVIPEFVRRGILPDLLTDETPADDPFSYIPRGHTIAQAAELRERDPSAYRERGLDSIADQARAMFELKEMGSLVFEFGNGIREQALAQGVPHAGKISDFASEYLAADSTEGRGLVTLVALSGDPGEIARVDDLFGQLFPESELQKWIAIARRHSSPGMAARSCWMGVDEAIKLGVGINDLVARGAIMAPVAMGRPFANRGTDTREILRSPFSSGESRSFRLGRPQNDSQALAHSAELDALLSAGRSAAWLSLQASAERSESRRRRGAAFVVIDGKPKTAERIEDVFARDFAS